MYVVEQKMTIEMIILVIVPRLLIDFSHLTQSRASVMTNKGQETLQGLCLCFRHAKKEKREREMEMEK